MMLQLGGGHQKIIPLNHKEENRRVNDELDNQIRLVEHFSSMAAVQTQKTIALKNVPKIIKQYRSEYLDQPELYASLGSLADRTVIY